jgi:predicted nucleic acid-binding protein
MARPTVPATEHVFSEMPPTQLYLDTNVLIAHFVSNHVHHERARDFLLHLFRSRVTILYVSPLFWIELTYVVSQPDFRAALPPEWRRDARLGRWHRAEVRRSYLTGFWVALEQLLDQFDWEEISISQSVRVQALAHVATYGLEPEDALHLAAAEAAGVMNIASFDAAFRRVDSLHLWNG